MVNIKYEGGEYVIDANIHMRITTNDIAKVQEDFAVNCAFEFAEEIKRAITNNNFIRKKAVDFREEN